MTVQLPPSVPHGTPNAYNHYECRCGPCTAWRKTYDADRIRRRTLERHSRRDACREYVREKGLRFYGPGPFRRNPIHLAQLIAGYLNDDLAQYVRDYRRRNET